LPQLFISFLAIALLVGCSTVDRPAETADWRLTGKLSLQTRDESRILSINWRQTGQRSDITLAGPLGVKVATVTAENGELTVNTSRQTARYQDDAVLETVGFEGLKLPWKSLAAWVRGTSGSDFRRGQWHFRVTEIGDDGPLVMRLEHPSVKLLLRVRKWQVFDS